MGCTDSKEKKKLPAAAGGGAAKKEVRKEGVVTPTPTPTPAPPPPAPPPPPPPLAQQPASSSSPAMQPAVPGKLASGAVRSKQTFDSPKSPLSDMVEPIYRDPSVTAFTDPEASVLSPTIATPRNLIPGRLVLFAHPASPPSRAVEWYFYYIKKDVKVHPVDLLAGEHKSQKYKAINPSAQVPALQIGEGLYLTEAAAILRFLSHGDENLSSREPRNVARLNEYVERHATVVRRLTTQCFSPVFFAISEDRPAALDAARRDLPPLLSHFEAVLGKQAYILGSEVTIADFLFATEVDGIDILGLLEPYPNIKAYLERMRGLQGYTRSADPFCEICEKMELRAVKGD